MLAEARTACLAAYRFCMSPACTAWTVRRSRRRTDGRTSVSCEQETGGGAAAYLRLDRCRRASYVHVHVCAIFCRKRGRALRSVGPADLSQCVAHKRAGHCNCPRSVRPSVRTRGVDSVRGGVLCTHSGGVEPARLLTGCRGHNARQVQLVLASSGLARPFN